MFLQRLKGNTGQRPWPLAAEITVLVLLKLILLTLLARSFFSHPQAPHMRMDSARVTERLLAPAPRQGGSQ